MAKITRAAVYYQHGRPYSYSLFREGQPVDAGPLRGIHPETVDFDEAYRLFACIRTHFNEDGSPRGG